MNQKSPPPFNSVLAREKDPLFTIVEPPSIMHSIAIDEDIKHYATIPLLSKGIGPAFTNACSITHGFTASVHFQW